MINNKDGWIKIPGILAGDDIMSFIIFINLRGRICIEHKNSTMQKYLYQISYQLITCTHFGPFEMH